MTDAFRINLRKPRFSLPFFCLAAAASFQGLKAQDATPPAQTADPIEQASQATSPLGKAIKKDQEKATAGQEPKKTVADEYLETYIGPDDRARVAFEPPPNSKSISKTGRLWVDVTKRRVYVDGYVAMREGALEMFACPVGSKEHESIVAVLAKSREVHAALLAVKAKPGSPVKFLPEFAPPQGQVIRIFACWRDDKGKFHSVDGRRWVQKNGTDDTQMKAEWVFGGSGFWKDPADGREYYRADGGDMICVSNFTTAMIDVNISSSANAGALNYVPFLDRIPKRHTPVRLVLVPLTKDSDQKLDESLLPVNENAESDLKANLKKRK